MAEVALLDEARFQEAARAIRAAHRATSRVVRLICRAVTQVGNDDHWLFRLDVGKHVDLDWTWEGARAFRGDVGGTDYGWSGDIVEVDDAEGHVYVRASTDESRPCTGEFSVRPFGFLEALCELYNGDPARAPCLRAALLHACGERDGEAVSCQASLPELKHVWSRSWGAIWGPPGTGKTWTIGAQVQEALRDPSERILVVSTTNKATDGVAIAIGKDLRDRRRLEEGVLMRVGSGADIQLFRDAGLEQVLVGGEAWLRMRLSELSRRHQAEHSPEERARLMAELQQVRLALSRASTLVLEAESRVVVTTAFAAIRASASEKAKELVEAGRPPFTTVIIDEAGLIPRVTAAGLAYLASKRVVVVGDPKQLSPSSKISRVLPPGEASWLAESALGHLDPNDLRPGVHLLAKQYRMHPDVSRVVSRFQYDGKLKDDDGVRTRSFQYDELLRGQPKAIWYVLDEDAGELPHIRADRGPGNRSWIRKRSLAVVEKILSHHPRMQQGPGLFISPFVAQTRELNRLFVEKGWKGWSASTTHKQQGAEADYVLFDTVNAGSTAWPHDEWKRLLNVGMSRAKQCLIVLSSRLEMQEPYMRHLASLLAPRVLKGVGGKWGWREVPVEAVHETSLTRRREKPDSLGAQIEARRQMRPIFSEEQQRLCVSKLDGGPRLVRGVAGSGKTVVLAHWLARTLSVPDAVGKHWVVYGNRALRGLLDEAIESAWRNLQTGRELPRHKFEVLHIGELLSRLEGDLCLRWSGDPFDYDVRSRVLLHRAKERSLALRCRALFVDEAQDLGPNTLELLSRLVEPRDPADPNSRAVMIFYDNAQNVYGRGTPKWSELGLDMRGRSTVMKESFRSTLPITELALNVLYRLQPPDGDPDHNELVARKLLEPERRNERTWWRVRYNHVGGPRPEVRQFKDRREELHALATRVRQWVVDEGVRPADIRIVANTDGIRNEVHGTLSRALSGTGAVVEIQRSQTYSADERTIVVTTAHSFKGYEGEIVAVPGADRFVASASAKTGKSEQVLASALYVALTRARSILYVSSTLAPEGTAASRINEALATAAEDLGSSPEIAEPSANDIELDLADRVGEEHRAWVERILKRFSVQHGPILDEDRALVAEPLFWFRTTERGYACFAGEVSRYVRERLEDLGFRVLLPGEAYS